MTIRTFHCFRLLNLKFGFGGVSGYLPAVYTHRTAESDAWTLHRAMSLGNNGSESKSESDSNTDGEMATSYPHEDASQLGYEKSEEIYRDWDKYWKAVQLNKSESLLSITQGSAVDWKNNTIQENGDADFDNKTPKGPERRWIFSMRHGERVDLTYGAWVQHCFDNDTYVRKDLNMPLKLGERTGSKESYAKDTPLTRVGQLQAQLVGEGLRLAGIDVRHVYASSALRCVETAHAFLEGLQADPSVKIKVEPGLFEYKVWHAAKGISFMTPLELHKYGLNVDLAYKPYVHLDINSSESLEEFYKRGEFVMHSVYNDTESEGGNVIFIGHATTLDLMATALQRLGDTTTKHEPFQIYKNLLRVPYCALAAVRDKPIQLVPPPCPPSINSSSGRYDWKILLDIWKS